MSLLFSGAATLKRLPAFVDGLQGEHVALPGTLKISALYPEALDEERRAGTDGVVASYAVYVSGNADIRHGDRMTIGGVEYEVTGVAPFPALQAALPYVRVNIERPKG